MSSTIKERYRGLNMAADAVVTLGGGGIAGFLAKTSGTITVTAPDGSSGTMTTVTLVSAVPVTQGVYTPIPLDFPQEGGTVQLGGGASGTLFI